MEVFDEGEKSEGEQGALAKPKSINKGHFLKNSRILYHTRVMHTCIDRLVKNQYMKLPSGGIMWGYCFVFCSSTC